MFDPEELVAVGSTVLVVPGVNTWRAIMPFLKRMGVRHVKISFYIDAMSNPYVGQYLKELVHELGNDFGCKDI